jgi:hypothetical protein
MCIMRDRSCSLKPAVDYVVEGTFRLMKGPETLPMNVLIQIRSTRFVRATRW